MTAKIRQTTLIHDAFDRSHHYTQTHTADKVQTVLVISNECIHSITCRLAQKS